MRGTGSARERRASGAVLACFAGSAACAVALTFVYWWDDDIQLEGAFLGASLLLLAAGLIVWSHHLMPEGPFFEEYPELRSPAAEEAAALASLDRGGVGRRRFLLGALGLVGASLTAGALSSVRSFGPAPFSLARTPWRGGRRMVTPEGDLVDASRLEVGEVLTVYPEGFIDSPEAAAVVIRVPDGLNRPLPGRAGWAPDGLLGYSKVCSHAGCPVNLYNRQTYQLQCPCHQSTFDVLEGAKPVFGPAGGPLAQLPVGIDPDGTLRSTGDFSAPPGPVFWHRS